MSFFDLLNNNAKLNTFQESYDENILDDLSDVQELVDSVNATLREEIPENQVSSGESFLNPIPSKEKVMKLTKELERLFSYKNDAKEKNDKPKLIKIDRLIAAVKSGIEASKFITGNKIKAFKWKKNKGYLVFHRGKTTFGSAISAVTFCPFSHVDLVVNGKSYTAYDGEGKGVNEYDIPEESEIVIYQINDKYFNLSKFRSFFEKTKGKEYAFDKALSGVLLGLSAKEKEDFESFFCSHWVVSCLDAMNNKSLEFHGIKLFSYGYDRFSPKLLYEYVITHDDFLTSKDSLTKPLPLDMGLYTEVTKVALAESFFGYGEDGEEDIPAEEPQEESTEEGPIEDVSFDDGGFDDGGLDNSSGDTGDGENKITDPLTDVDDSEKALVSDTRKSMTIFYENRENDLERILSSNINVESIEDSEILGDLINNYKETLSLFKEYLRNEYYEESTSRKIMSFIKYKSLFNQLNIGLNKYFKMIDEENKER